MPTDLDRMFSALASDAGAARLDPAAAVRKRADRRLAMQSVAGAAAVAVLVTGAVTGTRLVLTAQDGGPLNPPAQSAPAVLPPAPSTGLGAVPSDPPTQSPPSPASPPSSADTSAPAAPSIPKSVPDRAFLQRADWPGSLEGPNRTDSESPDICGTRWASDRQIGIRAAANLLYRDEGLPAEYVPNGTVLNTVTVYRGDGAADFLDELRAAAQDCDDHRILDGGDDSVLIELAVPAYNDDGTPAEGVNRSYLGATRVGDAVAMVSVRGWESASAERSAAETFLDKAADRLRAWRD